METTGGVTPSMPSNGNDGVETITPGQWVKDNNRFVPLVVDNPCCRQVDLALQEFCTARYAQRESTFTSRQIEWNRKMVALAALVALETSPT